MDLVQGLVGYSAKVSLSYNGVDIDLEPNGEIHQDITDDNTLLFAVLMNLHNKHGLSDEELAVDVLVRRSFYANLGRGKFSLVEVDNVYNLLTRGLLVDVEEDERLLFGCEGVRKGERTFHFPSERYVKLPSTERLDDLVDWSVKHWIRSKIMRRDIGYEVIPPQYLEAITEDLEPVLYRN